MPCLKNNPAWRVLSVAERIAAAGGLVVLSPVLGAVGMATAWLSGQSPLIGHRRLGLGGRPFWVLKFRTMWRPGSRPAPRFSLVEYIVDETGPRQKGVRDDRITSQFARFCRRHSIDELPQLLHVVRGQMSLVGPRPVTASEWNLQDRKSVV